MTEREDKLKLIWELQEKIVEITSKTKEANEKALDALIEASPNLYQLQKEQEALGKLCSEPEFSEEDFFFLDSAMELLIGAAQIHAAALHALKVE